MPYGLFVPEVPTINAQATDFNLPERAYSSAPSWTMSQVECWFSQLKFRPECAGGQARGRGGLGQAEVAVIQAPPAGALAARMGLWRLWRRFAEAYLNGPLLRTTFRMPPLASEIAPSGPSSVSSAIRSNPMACQIFREHFHVHGTSR